MTSELGEQERGLRLFVAIELPPDVRRALGDAIDVLKRAGVDDGLRWVRPDGIHLTLKFLGATPPAKVPAIVDALRLAVTGVPPFELRPFGLGTFTGGRHMQTRRDWQREPRHLNIRVLWVGLDGATDQLAALAAAVERAIEPLGYAGERQAYFGHLTLARVRDDADRAVRERMHAALEPYVSRSTRSGNFRPDLVPAFPPFTVDRVSLIRSTLQPGGAVYAVVETFVLG